MRSVYKIVAGKTRCDIVVGQSLSGTFRRLAAAGSRVTVVSDAAVAPRYGKSLVRRLSATGYSSTLEILPSGERSKSLAQAQRLYGKLARSHMDRRSWLIALGGGVAGDLTGFVAATYLRGIAFVQIPTTLLAQVDASIGGKTGVDIPEGKNLVGSFYQPRLVWIDPELLRTLPKAHWRNGLAEVIKYGAIADAGLFRTLERSVEKLRKGYSPAWIPIIRRCAQIKAEVVQQDPFETKGLRAILNFGHSVGHAIEAATGYRGYRHGEAISIGMFVAGFLSQQAGLLEDRDRIRLGTLLTRVGLPARLRKSIPRERILQFLARDKKTEAGSVRFVLLKGLGKAVSGHFVTAADLEAALSVAGL